MLPMKRYGLFTMLLLSLIWVTQEIKASPLHQIPAYPSTINVLFVQRNEQTDQALIDPVTGYYKEDNSFPNPRPVAFDTEYLPNVVRYEIGSSGLTQARQAQAVVARNFAWHKKEYPEQYDENHPPPHPCFRDKTCDVTNATDHQRYDPGVATQADVNAVNATANLFLAYSNQGTVSDIVSFTQFSKNHDTSYTSASPDGSPYLVSVYDPITQGPLGHGQGLSQDGAMLWERGNSALDYSGTKFPFWNRDQILAHYYTSVQLRHTNGGIWWGNYRWNALSINQTVFRTFAADTVSVVLQNTGVVDWETGTKLSAYWKRCTIEATPSCTNYLHDASMRPEVTIPSAASVVPGQDTFTLGTTPSMNLQSPSGLYLGSGYHYYLMFDLRRPNGAYFHGMNWPEQQWRVSIKNKPPKPTPTSPCTTRCVTPQSTAIMTWSMPSNPDPVTYVWKQTTGSGTVIAQGETGNPSLTLPLSEGVNIVSLRAQDTTEFESQSDEVSAGEFFYDPTPPVLTVDELPAWTNASAITLQWQGSDSLSGLASYTLEQQINGGAWTALLIGSQSTNYTISNLTNTTAYAFRVTAYDHAGNTTVIQRTVTVDRNPRTTILTTPIGPISKTWANIAWTTTSSDPPAVDAPVSYYVLDRLVNGAWHTVYPSVSGETLLFVGTPQTEYQVRIWAIDAAGNQQIPPSVPQITFTTGTDATGLHQINLPLLRWDTLKARDENGL